jgi:hypothetical protein
MLARQQARRSVWPLIVVVVGGAGYLWWAGTFGAFQNRYSNVDGPGPEVVHYTLAHQLVISAAVGLLLVAFLVGRHLAWQADLRVARNLICRVSSAQAESYRTVLGPWGVTLLCTQVATQIAVVIWAGFTRPILLTLIVALTCAASLGVSLVGLAREASRPAIAVDAVSLTLDQRTRTADALISCGAPSMSVWLTLGTENGGGWAALLAIPILVLGWGGASLLEALAAPKRRWRPPVGSPPVYTVSQTR